MDAVKSHDALPAGTAVTLLMYHKSFPKSAVTSYVQKSGSEITFSVVTGDEARLGGSDVCLHLQGQTYC